MTYCWQKKCLKFIFTMYRARLGQASFIRGRLVHTEPVSASPRSVMMLAIRSAHRVWTAHLFFCVPPAPVFFHSSWVYIHTNSDLCPFYGPPTSPEWTLLTRQQLVVNQWNSYVRQFFFFTYSIRKRNDPRSIACACNNRSKSGQTSCSQYFNH